MTHFALIIGSMCAFPIGTAHANAQVIYYALTSNLVSREINEKHWSYASCGYADASLSFGAQYANFFALDKAWKLDRESVLSWFSG